MPRITFASSDLVVEVAAGSMLLDCCESNDAPVAFGCRQGRCGTCCVEILAGAENLNPKEEVENNSLEGRDNEANLRLACLLEVRGDITIKQPG